VALGFDSALARNILRCNPLYLPVLIEVFIPEQILRLHDDSGALLRAYPCSTSRFGCGSVPESHCTPLGRFRIAQKIGHGAPPGTIFKSRVPVGRWDGTPGDEDYVLTRILWLDGLEPHNANTFDRYIYIHGTNQEHLIGTPASHGCVRLTNADVMDLFDRVPAGTAVHIRMDPHTAAAPA
jgi:lipoprotein-anchoring transpeptidase ErfK/SrfK